MSWTDYKNAPAPGTVLARSDDIAKSETLARVLDGYPVLIARTAAGLFAYVNACPHQYLPLDHKGDRLLSADQRTLRCTNHSAGFDIETGEGTEGLGLGCALDAIPIVERNGDIVVSKEPNAAI